VKTVHRAARSIVPVNEVAQGPQDGPFSLAAAPLGCGLKHPARQTGKGEGLEPYPARALQGRKEESFATEKGGLDAAGLLDVEVNAWLEGHDAPRIHMEGFPSPQGSFQDGATGVYENHAVPVQFLHDEAFAPEEACQDLSLEIDADGDPLGGAEETILLADQASSHIGQGDGEDVAGIGSAEGHARLPLPLVGKDGHEEAFPGENSLSRSQQLIQESAAST
jgi:hypothetical protein